MTLNIGIKTPGSPTGRKKTAPEITPGQAIPLKHRDRIKFFNRPNPNGFY
jgi:hypothetical protein